MANRLSLVQSQKLVKTVIAKLSPRAIRLVEARLEVKAQIDELQAKLERLNQQLLPVLDEHGGKLMTDEWTVTKVDASSAHIKKERLLQLGVKPTIIAKATETKPYSYVKVTLKARANGHE